MIPRWPGRGSRGESEQPEQRETSITASLLPERTQQRFPPDNTRLSPRSHGPHVDLSLRKDVRQKADADPDGWVGACAAASSVSFSRGSTGS